MLTWNFFYNFRKILETRDSPFIFIPKNLEDKTEWNSFGLTLLNEYLLFVSSGAKYLSSHGEFDRRFPRDIHDGSCFRCISMVVYYVTFTYELWNRVNRNILQYHSVPRSYSEVLFISSGICRPSPVQRFVWGYQSVNSDVATAANTNIA